MLYLPQTINIPLFGNINFNENIIYVNNCSTQTKFPRKHTSNSSTEYANENLFSI